MNALLVSTVVALGIGQPAAGSADGKWTIVYAEEGGRRNNAWEQRLATCTNGTLTYEDTAGKKISIGLKFGAHQTVNATVNEGGAAGKAWHGVYILGQDYLCLSLNKGGRKAGGGGGGGGAGGAGGAGAAGAAPAQPAAAGGGGAHSSADFIVILRRVRAKGAGR